jgi:hypothetical protein
MTKNIFLLIAFAFCLGQSFAQKQYPEKNKIYPVAKIYQKNSGIKLKVKNLSLVNDTLVQFSGGSTVNGGELSTNNIRYISVKRGTHVLEFSAGFGAGTLLLVASIATDPKYKSSKENIGGLVAGMTIAGTICGALIGVLIPKWNTLSIRSRSSLVSINLSPELNRQNFGLGINFNFGKNVKATVR